MPSSSSIFFFSASSFAILKLRIWPGFNCSRFGADSAGAPRAAAAPFHLLASIEDSADTSTGPRFLFLLLLLRGQSAVALDAFAEFHGGAVAIHVRHAAGYFVALLMLGDVFVERSGHQLLQAQPEAAFLAIVFEHDGAHHLADFQLVLRMIDALLVDDIADMDHAFDIFGHLHERAELLELRDRPFDDRADRDSSSPRRPTDRPAPA